MWKLTCASGSFGCCSSGAVHHLLRQSSMGLGSPRRLGWPTWAPGSHPSVPSQPRNYKCVHLALKNQTQYFLKNKGAGDCTQAFKPMWQALSYRPLLLSTCLPGILCSWECVVFYRQNYGFLQGKELQTMKPCSEEAGLWSQDQDAVSAAIPC